MTDAPLRRPERTFLGLPPAEDPTRPSASVVILGIPYGVAYPIPGAAAGCADAPDAIRAASARFARFRGHHDFDVGGPLLPPGGGVGVVDLGDVAGALDDPVNGERSESVVRALLDAGGLPVAIGGDDSVPIPFLRAFAGRGPITVLQVDAHLDFRDEVSGVREGYSSPMRRASEMDHVGRIVQVGLRGVGSARPGDVDDALRSGNLLVTARELRQRGTDWLADQLPAGAPLVLCFDADALDPAVCPAVSAPSPGGLSYDEADALLAAIAPHIAGAIFTELVPARDSDGLSALTVARLIIGLLGRIVTR